MMLGERSHHLNPTVQVPPWPTYDDPMATNGVSASFPVSGVNSPRNGGDHSPYLLGDASLHALRRFLPSNDSDDAIDAYSCDEFRIYEFKVRRCARGRSHDWTECPYAHPGEKARRRDPRKYHYSGTACPDFRKGNCKRGDACEFAHGVFECWLHPARYRTQPCKDGVNCRRRVCFFAHTPEQLRLLSPAAQQSPRTGSSVESYDGSPLRLDPFLVSGMLAAVASPPVSPPSESPPVSPSGVNDLLVSFRKLQIGKGSPVGSWVGSPRGVVGFGVVGSGFGSPSRMVGLGSGGVGLWEEPVERVESGRVLRAKRAEKLSKENCLESSEESPGGVYPDVDWVSELVM